jgi:septum formation protein
MLRQRGVNPAVRPADVDESIPPDLGVRQAVMYLALKKALRAETDWADENTRALTEDLPFILAADTVIYKDRVIGKPACEAEAYEIFELLRNTDHLACTGVAIVRAGAKQRRVFCECARVFFKDYSLRDLKEYVESGKAWDKAGGYAIQGEFSNRVRRVEGDVNTVVGLPLDRLMAEFSDMLREI